MKKRLDGDNLHADLRKPIMLLGEKNERLKDHRGD